MAHHSTEAGLGAQAVGYWQRAGQRAIERSANLEAISHLTKGLEVLTNLPDTPERLQWELDVQAAMGPALMAIRGFAAPEVEQAYARARALCRQAGEAPQLFPVLVGLWLFYHGRGELQTARELGEQLLTLAQRGQEPWLLLEAHLALGVTLAHLGETAIALMHLEHSRALYDPAQHRSLAFRSGMDPGMWGLAHMARALWLVGYPDQALQRGREAHALARELAHSHSLAFALFFETWIHQLRREGQAAQKRAEEVIALARDQGFAFWLGGGTILCGWALAEQGQAAEGMAQMRQGLAAWRATGSEMDRPYHLALLAEACGKGGQAAEGLSVLAEGLAIAQKNGDCFYEAELHRLQGELLLVLSPDHHTEAESCLQQALAVARHQQAKSLELRAATSLSRLWQQQGKVIGPVHL